MRLIPKFFFEKNQRFVVVISFTGWTEINVFIIVLVCVQKDVIIVEMIRFEISISRIIKNIEGVQYILGNLEGDDACDNFLIGYCPENFDSAREKCCNSIELVEGMSWLSSESSLTFLQETIINFCDFVRYIKGQIVL